MAFSSIFGNLEELPFNHTAGAAHPRFQMQPPMNYPALHVALIQLAVGRDKAQNIAAAVTEIHTAKKKEAELVVLPGCFNCPSLENFSEYAESIETGETFEALAKAAKDAGIWVVGGSVPERCGDKLFNTCTVWDHLGNLIVTRRKKFRLTPEESGIYSAGEDNITKFVYKQFMIGIGIGSEIVDSTMAANLASLGCSFLIYPGAFDMTPGPDCWQPLCRARANDLKLWVALVNRATDAEANIAFGNTMLIGANGPPGRIDGNPGTLHGYVYLRTVEMPGVTNQSCDIA